MLLNRHVNTARPSTGKSLYACLALRPPNTCSCGLEGDDAQPEAARGMRAVLVRHTYAVRSGGSCSR